MSQIAKRLAELSIALPTPAAPVANYVPFVLTTPAGVPFQLWISGQLPLGADGKINDPMRGKLGPEAPVEPARAAARLCAINVLAQAHAALGDLDRVARVIRLGGYFNVAASFDALPQAMNGASDLMVEVFGEKGRHARTTVGVAHLPLNALAEVEAVFEISP
jgi:enamine deaminase RidA (YjgF/YER057c/UK114 family)